MLQQTHNKTCSRISKPLHALLTADVSVMCLFKNMLKKIILTTLILALIACSGSYTFKMFAYPEEARPHENEWKYLGEILVRDPYGVSPVESIEKELEISIKNKQGKKLLHEVLKVTGGTFDYNIQWKDESVLIIEVMGDNPKVIKPILILKYVLNGKMYVRDNT